MQLMWTQENNMKNRSNTQQHNSQGIYPWSIQPLSIEYGVKLWKGLIRESWDLGFLDTLINILLAISLDFCGDQSILYYSCELPSLFPLSCSDVSTNFTVLLCSSLLSGLGTYVLIVYSHTLTLSTIPSISSFSGRSKIFSTYSSHLTVVLLFCGAAFLSFFIPNSGSVWSLSPLYRAVWSFP